MKRRGFFAWVGGLFAATGVEASALPKCEPCPDMMAFDPNWRQSTDTQLAMNEMFRRCDTCGKPGVEECRETIPDGVEHGFAKWRQGRAYWLCKDHSHAAIQLKRVDGDMSHGKNEFFFTVNYKIGPLEGKTIEVNL